MSKLVYEHFPNIKMFLDILKKRESTGKCNLNVETMEDRDFTEYTYNESVNLIYSGIETVRESMKKIGFDGNVIPVKSRPIKSRYYYGYSPNVPAAIAGQPKSMYRMIRQPQKIKTINLVYNVSVLGTIEKSTINKAGQAFFNIAYNLEKQGFRVKITLVLATTQNPSGQEKAVLTVCLKDYKDSFDIQKLSFPLCSVAMYRIFGFNWREKAPFNEYWSGGGRSFMDKDKEKALLKESGFNLSDAVYLNVDDFTIAKYNVNAIMDKVKEERGI